MVFSVVKYWYRNLLMERDELLRCYYEGQTENLKCASWAVSPTDELYKIGLGYIWLDRVGGGGLTDACQIIKTGRHDRKNEKINFYSHTEIETNV
jgi:hypothetical protein